jgi:hypothetical protein
VADDTNSGMASGLSGLMQLADPQLLISVGAGLMSGARYGSNAGEGLMQGLQMYQGMKQAGLQRQLMQQQVQAGSIANQRQQMMLSAAQQAMQGGQPGGLPSAPSSPGPPDASQTPFLPGISQMPPSAGGLSPTQPTAPQAQQGGALPTGLVPPSPGQIYGTAYPGGADPNYMRAMAMFSEDPASALLKVREDQLKGAQQQYAPTIARLDQLIKSDAPAKYMSGTGFQDFKAAWPQMASTLGLDPDKDYNDQNVRLALSHVRNQLTSSLSEPTETPPQPLRTIRLQDGRMAQVEPGTGKITPIASEDLQSVIGQGGQPTLVPRGQAAGMTPYNQWAVTDQQMQSPGGQLLARMQSLGVSFPGARSPQQQMAFANNFMRQNPGVSIDDAARQLYSGELDFNGAKRSTGQLATQSAAADAQMRKLEKDFGSLDPLVAKLPNAPALLNKAFTGLKNNLSFGGDKDSAELVGWLREAATEYARLSSGSTGSAAPAEGNIHEAVSIFQNAYTQGGYEGLKSVIMGSGQHKRDSVTEALQRASAPGYTTGRVSPTDQHPSDIQDLLKKYGH